MLQSARLTKPRKVYKTKSFDRWAKKILPDVLLCSAAREIERGLYDADLGQGVCKKRISIPGRGKRGGARTLVAKQHVSAVVFLVGREKSEPGSDFPAAVVEAAKLIAADLQAQSIERLQLLAESGSLKEICNDEDSE